MCAIKPCPFCGNQPELVSIHKTGRGAILFMRSETHPNTFWYKCCIVSTRHFDNKEAALQQWNTRTDIKEENGYSVQQMQAKI